MNLYRLTVRDADGKISDFQKIAASLHFAVQDLDRQLKLVKAEQIDPFTGQVLGELFGEQDRN
jgi:hypothetical protein